MNLQLTPADERLLRAYRISTADAPPENPHASCERLFNGVAAAYSRLDHECAAKHREAKLWKRRCWQALGLALIFAGWPMVLWLYGVLFQ